MTATTTPGALDPADVRTRVDDVLGRFLDEQEHTSSLPEMALFTEVLRRMLDGGKRIRPLLCVTGWQAVREQAPPETVMHVAASLELFHAFALIHDDIMDRSATRRGQPSAHRVLAARHAHRPDADLLGVNAAILLGDLAFGWSYELLHEPILPAQQMLVVWPLLNALRAETLIGQYLDLRASRTHQHPDPDTAWRIVRYKTAKYTFERPLQLGAVLAGATPHQLRTLSAYALPLGEAFQLRDDLLGVFGDPARTGKSTLDDLREGKHTMLCALALERADGEQAKTLRALIGDPDLDTDGADRIRTILVATGARDAVEEAVKERAQRALRALDGTLLQPGADILLRQIATTASSRDS
ncbi:polyprenyl synthetase family protein [Streptomyces alanosinicus]|uniref:Polyprenyl synthetase n=1 Tax=Streptomyces alanosinicus TaxID=68171 RepID=A0A919D4F8_9ACTN|nr:polyprenyl synthetase family protein [Streptomyces alanosinicus]GHE06555.1 polyprenyl synthetase [Streptomyces alanosinicus]